MAAKKNEQYVALYSDCGDDSQLQVVDGDNGYAVTHDSVVAARTKAKEHADGRRDNGEDQCRYAVAKIIERGVPGDIIWK